MYHAPRAARASFARKIALTPVGTTVAGLAIYGARPHPSESITT
jgi:hypothetical protein